MKIGIDIMGGDYAPNEVVLGVIQSLPELEGDTRLVLFGDEVAIKDLFSRENADISLVDIVHTTEVIGMEGDVIVTQSLFKFEYLDETDDGKIIGEFRSSGLRPYTLEKARQFGFDQAYLEACL